MNPVWHFVNGVPTGGVMAPSLVLVGDGSAAAPSYSFASDPDTGMWRVSGGVITGIDGVGYAATFTNQFQLATGGALTWSSGAITAAADVSLSRGAANRLDLASGDSLYLVSGGLGVGVAPPAAGAIQASGNILTGNELQVSGFSRLQLGVVNGQANLLNWAASAGIGLDFATDGTLKIRNRAQNADGSITLDNLTHAAAGATLWNGRSQIFSPADGVIQVLNAAATGFTRLILGTNNTSGVALKKDGVGIQLADGAGTAGAFLSGVEQTAPSAPSANGYRIFAQDNGAGKTQLMVIFASGAAQQLAIEP